MITGNRFDDWIATRTWDYFWASIKMISIISPDPNPDKPENHKVTRTQTTTVHYKLTSCLGALAAKIFC
jgi:hypothetical protein